MTVHVLAPVRVFRCLAAMSGRSILSGATLGLTDLSTSGNVAALDPGVYEIRSFTVVVGEDWYLLNGTAWGAWPGTWSGYQESGACRLVLGEAESLPQETIGTTLESYVRSKHGREFQKELGRGRVSELAYYPDRNALVEHIYLGATLLSDSVLEYLGEKIVWAGEKALMIREGN